MSGGILRSLIEFFRPITFDPPGPRPIEFGTLPEGVRIYAIGDIHGYSDLLARMADRIDADVRRNPPEQALAVFLGDYIDRGPDSSGVIERLVRGDFPIPFETLRGNHEDLMRWAVGEPDAMADWCASGGIETLRSYGIDIGLGQMRKRPGKLRKALLERLPSSHLAFLKRTKSSYSVGGYFFVHAGARPGVPLDRQSEADLLWIRDDCYRAAGAFEKVLVHGHTPRRRPENLPWRINVDTGAFKWGVLSCVALEGNARRFLSIRRQI